MRILVVGGGAREHALVWKLKQSKSKPEMHCIPGNAGIAAIARCVEMPSNDVNGILAYVEKEKIDFTVVGPEAPLVAGIVDKFQSKGKLIFGPTAGAAMLEGSKVYAKEIMAKHSIPTAAHRVFAAPESALSYVENALDFPMVLKASGLAAGKGVVIAKNREQAILAIKDIMVDRIYGAAGDQIVIEDFLDGEEVSVMALTDGHTILVLDSSQDHKRAFDGDEGPNTGGMGAYSPAPCLNADTARQIEREVLVPIVHAMKQERRAFRGVIYAGMMLTKKGPKVLEFNVRFGDPECEVLLARMKCDFAETLKLCAEGKLKDAEVEWDPRPAVCVVVAQNGYPGSTPNGQKIGNLPKDGDTPDTMVYHGATRYIPGGVAAWGGRVLCVTALGDDFRIAAARCYDAIAKIDFPGSFCRKDIAQKVIRRAR